MTPYKHLKHDTYYAILFCNNVPTVPINLLEASWIAFTMGTMGEDKLIIFKTADSVDFDKTWDCNDWLLKSWWLQTFQRIIIIE